MADFTKFRTALNGFNRSDVSSYIETSSAEHQNQVKQLQSQIDELTAQLEKSRAQQFANESSNRSLKQKLSEAETRLTKAQADLDEQTAMSEDLLRQLDETETALKATQDALEEALTPDEPQTEEPEEEEATEEAPDYASLELEAYRRAEAMERLSAERTARLRLELDELLEQVSSRYEQTGQEIQVLSEDIRSNLQRLTEAMSDLDVIFDETSAHFEDMDACSLDEEEDQ